MLGNDLGEILLVEEPIEAADVGRVGCFAEGVRFAPAVDKKAPDDDPLRPLFALDDDVETAVRLEMGKNHPAEDGPVPLVVQGGLEIGQLDVPDGRGLGILRHQGQEPVEQLLLLQAPPGEIGVAVEMVADDLREAAQVVFPVKIEDLSFPVPGVGLRIGRLPFLKGPDGVEPGQRDSVAFFEPGAVLGQQPAQAGQLR